MLKYTIAAASAAVVGAQDWFLTMNLDQLNDNRLNRLENQGIHLRPGEAVRLQAEQNASTGYSWQLTEIPSGAAITITEDC